MPILLELKQGRSAAFLAAICISLTSLSQALAGFDANLDYCVMTQNFTTRTSEGVEFDGLFNLSFNSKGTNIDGVEREIAVPMMSVSLSRNIKAKSISLSWPNPDLLDSQQRPIFQTAFHQRISLESGKVFNLTKDGSMFFTKPYGFYRLQNLSALFLSQNIMTIKFVEEGKENVETIELPLAGSDEAFRKIVHKCNPKISEDYLASDISRKKKPLFDSWSDGYGITNYADIAPLLPEGKNDPQDISDQLPNNFDESHKKFLELGLILKEKSMS